MRNDRSEDVKVAVVGDVGCWQGNGMCERESRGGGGGGGDV